MRRLILAVAVLATASCVSAGVSAGEHRSRDRNLLTLEEIEASHMATAYDLIRSLRPQWLRVQGPNSFYSENPVSVYLDGARMGSPDALKDIPKLNVREIRFYSGPEAQSRFGLNNTNGAIAVRTRSG